MVNSRWDTGRAVNISDNPFDVPLVIDTPEAGANLAKAIEHYEKYGPYIPKNVQGVTRNPEIIDRIMGVKR